MAEKRMFSKKITDNENFYSLSASAQALYFHLAMCADDDGFSDQLSLCMFKAHASVSDLEILLNKKYVYQFENGVIVIKHWKINNTIRQDRYHATVYQDEFKRLFLKSNSSYTLSITSNQQNCSCLPDKYQVSTIGLPDGNQVVNQWETEDRIDKIRLDKISIDKIDIISFDSHTEEELFTCYTHWNECGYHEIENFTYDRKIDLYKIIQQYGLLKVIKAMDRIKESDYLLGKVNGFIINFDWFLNPRNFIKVSEGNYDNHNYKAKQNFENKSETYSDMDDFEKQILSN